MIPKTDLPSAIQARDIVISWKMAIFVGLIVCIFRHSYHT